MISRRLPDIRSHNISHCLVHVQRRGWLAGAHDYDDGLARRAAGLGASQLGDGDKIAVEQPEFRPRPFANLDDRGLVAAAWFWLEGVVEGGRAAHGSLPASLRHLPVSMMPNFPPSVP